MTDYSRALIVAEAAAREVAALLRDEFYREGGPRGQGDHCPADNEAEAVIRARLCAAFPEWAYLGEETGTGGCRGSDHCWLVDPNDGTSSFRKGHRGASVSIGLVHGGLPVLGVVLAHTPPVGEIDCVTWAEGCGPLRRNGAAVERSLASELGPDHTVLVSQDADRKPLANASLAAPARYRPMASIAYRLALVAVDEGDAATSLNGPCGWDFAAGHALLRGVGGELVDQAGAPIRYSVAGSAHCQACFGGHPTVASRLAGLDWARVRQPEAATGLLQPKLGSLVADGRRDRAQGVLLGQLCGDALGAQVEFLSPNRIAAAWPAGVRSMRDGGTHNTLGGQATDDSEMALSLARSLVGMGRYDDDAVAAAYAAWRNTNPFDIGNTTSQALRGGKTAAALRAASSATSTANGALMRISPLGIFGHSFEPEAAADLARRDASLTHPNAVNADANAIFVASIAFAVRTGCDAATLHTQASQWASAWEAHPDVRDALAAASTTPLSSFPSQHPGDVRFSFFAAWRQILHVGDAVDALSEVVGQGRDSDTDAAIAGALFGAVHGASAFPVAWRDRVLTARPLSGAAGVRQARPWTLWGVDALLLAERLVVCGEAAARA